MYAGVIVDISHEKLDKVFTYSIPTELQEAVRPGVCVNIPFGRRIISGYVVEISEECGLDPSKIKPIKEVVKGSVAVEGDLIALAAWIRKNYGGTMNQALKTVLPVKKETKELINRTIYPAVDSVKLRAQLALCEAKNQKAKARVLRELLSNESLDYSYALGTLKISSAAIKALEQSKIITVVSQNVYRNPVEGLETYKYDKTLNAEQQAAVDQIVCDIDDGKRETYLLKGVTGSGKTEVYMELIAECIERGKQAIVLIPEIALTYQTVRRFLSRFPNRVSIMNSKLSAGERYDQFLRAKNSDIDIMIGPRSALFTPFERLGLIIIDEEHETSYKSESVPKYHTKETAIEYAKMRNAAVVLGSATPSIDSYFKAMSGEYQLIELKHRVDDRPMPECEIVDLRQELKNGNRSILSTRLQELMEERLSNNQQTMLFINRRGLAGFVSCRACGHVIKCPHCDVSLSQHTGGLMKCHYCGYTAEVPKLCPECGSKYISGFKAGTQKIEEIVQRCFPNAKIFRMDFDTTRTKDSYEQILKSFAEHKADILIGTQMIVKGHDFPKVTLVGVLAADMSLNISDFCASERSFNLLTQAAGRAGRGQLPGEVVIQTYDPTHFVIQTAKDHDYEKFYKQEISYRTMLRYPPIWNMLVILISSADESKCKWAADDIYAIMDKNLPYGIQLIGPAEAAVSKVKDVYRMVVYLKAEKYGTLVDMKDLTDNYVRENTNYKNVSVQFDFNPVNGF